MDEKSNADNVRSMRVPEGEPPTPEVIAARIDLGTAEYHETCCAWALYRVDESLFDFTPDCDCGGPEMAKTYALLAFLPKSNADNVVLALRFILLLVVDAVAKLDAEHYPDPELKGKGGCVMCWPKDGSWPCVSRMVADELRGSTP